MPELNDSQFAKYSAIKVPHRTLEYDIKPLPASMERHGEGSYQPTLPGMENMLKGEQTHADVFFKHKNAVDREIQDVPGSNWYNKSRTYVPEHVRSPHSSLHPTQDWVDDNYINSEATPPKGGGYHEGGRPLVERVRGLNIVHDGHHRIVRDMLAGKTRTDIARWR